MTGLPDDEQLAARSAGSGRALRGLLGLVAFLVLGVGLRMAHASALEGRVHEWEADGFVQAWEGRPWGAWNRLRPPALGMLLNRANDLYDLPTAGAVRWACVGLSVLGLLAAFELARSLSRHTGLDRRSALQAASWAAAIWAVHPTLIRSAVSPTPELLVGPALCLVLSRLVARRTGGWVSLAGLALCAALAVVAGGAIVLLAMLACVLVYLLPVPRLPVTLRALSVVAVAAGALWIVQRGPDPTRTWLPDTAPMHSFMSLIDAPPPHPNDLPTNSDRRELLLADITRRALRDTPPTDVLREFGLRLRRDALGTARLEPLLTGTTLDAPGWQAGLGAFDLFLRGGLLLFACTVLGLLRRRERSSSLPRAGAVVGLLVYLVASVAGAVGPLSLAGFDLVLLGVAAGGVAGTSADRGWTRRLAFLVGGVLLCTFLYTAGMKVEPLSPWIDDAGQLQHEGAMLVDLLDRPEPENPVAELSIANLLMQPGAPLLRQPEAALTHSLQATHLLPTDDASLEVLIRAHVEAASYRDAARLAEAGLGVHPAGSMEAKRMELMLDWVRQEQRLSQGLPPGR